MPVILRHTQSLNPDISWRTFRLSHSLIHGDEHNLHSPPRLQSLIVMGAKDASKVVHTCTAHRQCSMLNFRTSHTYLHTLIVLFYMFEKSSACTCACLCVDVCVYACARVCACSMTLPRWGSFIEKCYWKATLYLLKYYYNPANQLNNKTNQNCSSILRISVQTIRHQFESRNQWFWSKKVIPNEQFSSRKSDRSSLTYGSRIEHRGGYRNWPRMRS